jgi:hypothetical protein
LFRRQQPRPRDPRSGSARARFCTVATVCAPGRSRALRPSTWPSKAASKSRPCDAVFSGGEVFALAIRQLPYVTILGDHTNGIFSYQLGEETPERVGVPPVISEILLGRHGVLRRQALCHTMTAGFPATRTICSLPSQRASLSSSAAAINGSARFSISAVLLSSSISAGTPLAVEVEAAGSVILTSRRTRGNRHSPLRMARAAQPPATSIA